MAGAIPTKRLVGEANAETDYFSAASLSTTVKVSTCTTVHFPRAVVRTLSYVPPGYLRHELEPVSYNPGTRLAFISALVGEVGIGSLLAGHGKKELDFFDLLVRIAGTVNIGSAHNNIAIVLVDLAVGRWYRTAIGGGFAIIRNIVILDNLIFLEDGVTVALIIIVSGGVSASAAMEQHGLVF